MRHTWQDGAWLNKPEEWRVSGDTLHLTTDHETDFWRTTSYGFARDSGHALLFDLPDNSSFECSFEGDFSGQFDQAGILLRASATHWIKCGVEYADRVLGVGAVVTSDVSDWSTSPHPAWADTTVTLRVSRLGDAVTIRACSNDGPWELVRLAPIDPELDWQAGPFAASPTRSGLAVAFSSPEWGAAETSPH